MHNQLFPTTMYTIRQDHLILLQLIEDAEGELTPEIEQQLALTEEQFQEKAISYGFVVKGFQATEEVIDAEIKRLTALKQTAQKRGETFKQRLDEGMRQFGVEKIETPTLTLSYRKSKSVELDNDFEDSILKYIKVQLQPDWEKIEADGENFVARFDTATDLKRLLEFFTAKLTVSKKLIGEALKEGEKIKGATISDNKNLQIK